MRNQLKPVQTFEFEITETRTYYVQGAGHTPFEAEQDASDRFYRLSKSRELVAHKVSKPKVSKGKLVKR